MKRPNFFIVGAPRCGTTAMWAFLRQHPQIFMTSEKEPHFFGGDLADHPSYVRDLRDYLALFDGAGSKSRLGEASVFYLYSICAAQEIKDFDPDARIIVMLRNPVDMMHSLHAHRLRLGGEDIVDFQAALEAEGERKRGLRLPKLMPKEGCLYRDFGRYAQQLERYLKHFGSDRVHVILYDDLLADTPGVYRSCLNFLGAEENFQPEFKVINHSGHPRLIPAYWFLHNSTFRKLGKAMLSEKVRRLLDSRLHDWNSGTAPVDPSLRRRLQSEFLPEVQHLSELLERNLTHWCKS